MANGLRTNPQTDDEAGRTKPLAEELIGGSIDGLGDALRALLPDVHSQNARA
jgi:hypothetical protein